jgi:hypothetical protein
VAQGFNRIEAQASEQDVEILFPNGNESVLIRTDYRKTQPEFLLFYKRTNGKLMAYHAAYPNHHRADRELRCEPALKTVHRPSRKVSDRSGKKAAYPGAGQAPLKRKVYLESYQ